MNSRVFLLTLVALTVAGYPARAADPLYEIELTEATRGFDGKTCWVHARAGAIPPNLPVNPSSVPLVVMTFETWVTVTEWMQGPAPHSHDPAPLVARGADNRVWVAKLKWAGRGQAN